MTIRILTFILLWAGTSQAQVIIEGSGRVIVDSRYPARQVSNEYHRGPWQPARINVSSFGTSSAWKPAGPIASMRIAPPPRPARSASLRSPGPRR